MSRRNTRGLWAAASTAAVIALAGASVAAADPGDTSDPVTWDAGPDAARVGLIGDSTLSGVRWVGRYGDLERFSVRFDAESCRRTIDTSCWSREQFRPVNAMTTLQRHAGGWGEVLVMMTGYNDSDDRFADGVRAIVDEARRQGIGTVLWLSLRTKGVDYEEPLHRANGNTYRNANRTLYMLATELDGYLQVADWASYSADRPEWFEADGAHLARPGVEAVTGFIARQLEVVLAGGTVTADPPPWEDLRRGDRGELVIAVQEALLAAGFGQFGEVDGVFGSQTWGAVGNFQRSVGLPDHGIVDQSTATRLGLWASASAPAEAVSTSGPVAPTTTAPPSTAVATAPPTPGSTSAPTVGRPPPTPAAATRSVPPASRRGADGTDALWVVVALSPAMIWLAQRWVRERRLQL